MSLAVIECDSRWLSQRGYESVNAKLSEIAALIRACGIPEPFHAQLSAMDPARNGIPHDFALSIGWEGVAYGAQLDGWYFFEKSAEERISYVDHTVRAACRGLLDEVMRNCRAREGK